MHKSEQYQFTSCVESLHFFTGKIIQQNLWGNVTGFCARFTNLFQSFYTFASSSFSLLHSVYARFAQELLLELHINKLIKG